MRLSVRAIALAMSAVTILGTGAVAVSVNASAIETPPPEAASTDVVPVAVDTTDAELDVELKTVYLKAARLRLIRQHAAAIAQARKDAKELRIQKIRARVITVAKKQIGDRYSAGSSGPSAFDCSGFTRYVYRVAAGKYLPHYSRAQYDKVKKIRLSQARPGDLVFFLRNGAHHVGIYLGNGRMVDAAGYGKGVRISPISGSWWSRSFTGVGRLLPA